MEESCPSSKKSPANLWLWVLVGMLLYVLSIGPATYLLHRTNAGKSVEMALIALYFPVTKAAELTRTQETLRDYLDLWTPDPFR